MSRQFASTKQQAADPLKAAEVYNNMRTAIWDAEEAAAEAEEAVDGASEKVGCRFTHSFSVSFCF